MFKNFWRYEKSFAVAPYDFRLFAVWAEAFRQKAGIWVKLLVADFILIVILHLPVFGPYLAAHIPFLSAFHFNDKLEHISGFFLLYRETSRGFFPLLYGIFITAPMYLGVNLLALRIAYERPAKLGVIWHYFRFFWWSNVVGVVVFGFLIFLPWTFATFFALNKIAAVGFSLKWGGLLALGVLGVLAFMIFLSFALYLIFGARIRLIEGARMSWSAVQQHFFGIVGMCLFSYLVWNVGERTWYLSDIFFYPANLMAWALLYRKIFGEKGLVE